jgi:hypothetical protein
LRTFRLAAMVLLPLRLRCWDMVGDVAIERLKNGRGK